MGAQGAGGETMEWKKYKERWRAYRRTENTRGRFARKTHPLG
jgi:hypothetical protein